MKARVKATGEIVEVKLKHFSDFVVYVDENGVMYKGLYDLDFDLEENHKGSQIISSPYEPDYWEKLKHQAAIAAMQGILSNDEMLGILGMQKGKELDDMIGDMSVKIATALVNKLKEEEK